VIIREDKQEVKYEIVNTHKVVLECTQAVFEELIKAVDVLNKRRNYHREYKRKEIGVKNPHKIKDDITFIKL